MTSDHELSDEQLNAFIDGQLSSQERSRILSALSANEALGRRACELRRLRDLVQHAYDQPPVAPARQAQINKPSGGWQRAVAAALLLSAGASLGWLAHARQSQPLNIQAMYLDEEKAFQTSALEQTPMHGEQKILLHLSSAEPEKLDGALTTVEKLLARYQQRAQPVEVELVVNAGGLNLLRADTSPYAQRVSALQRKYDNLTFVACQTAIDRLQRETSLTPDLLPEALITPNALEEILTRLQQGWVYISV